MVRSELVWLFIAMGAVTFIPRWLPLFFLSQRQLPEWFVDWLDLIPVAVLSALVVPELMTEGIPRNLSLVNSRLLVAIPAFLFALKTKSLGGTVVVGMLLFWLAGMIF
jgi:branched-subunit amino acid transport protein